MAHIHLSVPAKAEYLVTARLTAASVAGQAGFDVDIIDDIKTACAEACLLLLQNTEPNDELEIGFMLGDNEGLHIEASAPSSDKEQRNSQEEEFSHFLLEALMDEVAFSLENGRGVYRLFKALHDI